MDCLVPRLSVNTQMCTEKTEHGADQVGKMCTCIQGVKVQFPVGIPTFAVFFSFLRTNATTVP